MLMPWKRRYWVLAVVFCAYLMCYMDRMVMASAIPFIAKDLSLSPIVMGQVLSSFFIGYALMQIPGGVLADVLGPRAVLSASVVWWSAMTALTGAAPGLTALILIRILFGVGEVLPSRRLEGRSRLVPTGRDGPCERNSSGLHGYRSDSSTAVCSPVGHCKWLAIGLLSSVHTWGDSGGGNVALRTKFIVNARRD